MFNFMSKASASRAAEDASCGMTRSGSNSSLPSTTSQQQRIQDLEEQLKQLSYTAASALDRVSELESQLERRDTEINEPPLTETRVLDPFYRLQSLERAIKVIHDTRSELRKPTYFSYT